MAQVSYRRIKLLNFMKVKHVEYLHGKSNIQEPVL